MAYNTLKQNSRRLVALLFAAMFFLSICQVVMAAETSGTCGDNIIWTLNGTTLTISGSGVIQDYQEFSLAPWNEYADSIYAVVVEDGVTRIGNFAFFGLTKVSAVNLADSVASIGEYAFYGCTRVELLNLGNGLQEIGRSAFEECTGLMSVKLPEGLKSIGFHGFYRCENLKSITVPSSVTVMGTTVFGYCTNLRSARILAAIKELPLWTFYGCYKLSDVTLSSDITSVGVYAFHGCDNISEDSYVRSDGDEPSQTVTGITPSQTVIDSTTVQQEDGGRVTTDNRYLDSENSAINVETVKTQTENSTTVDVTVDALLEKKEGWGELEQEVNNVLIESDLPANEKLEVVVSLKEDSVLSGNDLARFAGKNVKLTIHTMQGAYWHINGQDIKPADLAEAYELAFSVREITDPTEGQKEAVGIGKSYAVAFHSGINFKTEVELPLGNDFRLATAIFFAPADKGYDRMQSVIVDEEGVAHFYLANVQAETEYLVGINIPDKEADSNVNQAIVPDALQNKAQRYEQVEEIEYIVTGVKSSWGMDFGQVTWILAGVMLGSVVIVGIVMYIIFKSKLKKGYVPGEAGGLE